MLEDLRGFLMSYPQAMHIHRVQRMLDKRTYSDARGFLVRVTRIFSTGYSSLLRGNPPQPGPCCTMAPHKVPIAED